MTSRRAPFTLLLGILSILVLCVASPAWARGIKAEKTTLEEDLESHHWKLKLVIDHGSAPTRDNVPMVFTFKQTARYVRALTDASPDKPVEQTEQTPNTTPTSSDQEVSFADPGTGKRFAVTKFPITIRRKDDFEAGEYELTIKIVDGPKLGTVKLFLKGQNKVENQRTLSLGASVGGPKKAKPADEGKASAPESKGGAAEDQGPDLSNIPDTKAAPASAAAEPEAPPPVPPKQGGCGCRVAGEPSSETPALAAALVLGLAALTRRGSARRKATRRETRHSSSAALPPRARAHERAV